MAIEQPTSPTAPASQRSHHTLPVLLCACYLMALMLPSPGVALHHWELPSGLPEVLRPRLPQLLVALLLLLAAMGAELKRLPQVARRPLLLVATLVAVWLVPALVVIPLRWLLPLAVDGEMAVSLVIGFALVAAMPVANSSAAWTQQSRGELPWSLAVVVLSILLSPWVIPLVLWLLGLTFTSRELQGLEQLMDSFTGMKFVVWVLLPTALGMLIRWSVGSERVARNRPRVLLASTSALLLLNYLNASVALPQMHTQFLPLRLLIVGIASLGLCMAGLAASRLLERGFRTTRHQAIALEYSLTMKNTGLGMALASHLLNDQPAILLPLLAVTLIQHLFASWLHARAVGARQAATHG